LLLLLLRLLLLPWGVSLSVLAAMLLAGAGQSRELRLILN
jgi:hypothetical protein